MNDFDKLKELLFGEEKQKLASITDRIEQPEVRTVDVADVLAESVHQSHAKNKELVASLKEPVGECLQEALREDPQTYSDALYPIMGPAIRKSIAHALKTFSQQINQAVEQSLTPKGLKWRLQASRAGIPFGEFMLQKSLLYRIEQAYLISRENGLLIEHVHHAASKIKDSDAVSAMFIAIQDFVKESFSTDRTGRLESVDMGEFTLWAIHGPHAMLVCVIRGVPPRSLRGHLSAILERIHFQWGDAIRHYSGDSKSVTDIDVELERCLNFQATQDEKRKRGKSVPLLILGLLVVALVVYWGVISWRSAQHLDDIEKALIDAPGIYVTAVTQTSSQIFVRGLRDPLAPSVADLIENLSVSAKELTIDMSPFQSLEPEIIAKRVARLLAENRTVAYELEGSNIVLSGEASTNWIQNISGHLLGLAGIEHVDIKGLKDSTLVKLTQDVKELSGARFLFSGGINYAPDQKDKLRDFAIRLQRVQTRAAINGYTLNVTIVGSTDKLGSVELNTELAGARASVVAAVLSEYGVTSNQFKRMNSSIEGAAARKVVVKLNLVSLTSQLP